MLISLPLLWESIAEANFILQDLLGYSLKGKSDLLIHQRFKNQKKIEEPHTL